MAKRSKARRFYSGTRKVGSITLEQAILGSLTIVGVVTVVRWVVAGKIY